MIVGFARYSRDRSFVVLRENRRFVLVMAAGSIVGSFVGGQLLGLVPVRRSSFPLLAVILVISADQGLAAQIAAATMMLEVAKSSLSPPSRRGA